MGKTQGSLRLDIHQMRNMKNCGIRLQQVKNGMGSFIIRKKTERPIGSLPIFHR